LIVRQYSEMVRQGLLVFDAVLEIRQKDKNLPASAPNKGEDNLRMP
jgi:hypothetical protein